MKWSDPSMNFNTCAQSYKTFWAVVSCQTICPSLIIECNFQLRKALWIFMTRGRCFFFQLQLMGHLCFVLLTKCVIKLFWSPSILAYLDLDVSRVLFKECFDVLKCKADRNNFRFYSILHYFFWKSKYIPTNFTF